MKNNQQGISLIEVLVALLLLAIAVLGFVALQTSSIQATGESLERTQSLVLMRELAERVRANPTAIEEYQKAINNFTLTEPSPDCAKVLCTPNQLAAYDTYQINQQIQQYGFRLGIDHCPNTGGKKGKATNAQATYSYCLITAWGDTLPQYGETEKTADGKLNCLKRSKEPKPTDGGYYRQATCMFMELT